MRTNTLFVEECESTNLLLAQKADREKLPEGFLIHTDFQTAGQGQQGNSWDSARSSNLLFSLLLHPKHIAIDRQFVLSQATSLAIRDVLLRYTDKIQIKWPNDIYHEEKKLGGILIQNSIQQNFLKQSIVGVGLNINQVEFSSRTPNPVSLRQIIGQQVKREKLLQELYDTIMQYYRKTDRKDFTPDYMAGLFRNRGFHRFRDSEGSFEACIQRVGKDGRLYLEDSSGKRRSYYFKEVEFIL